MSASGIQLNSGDPSQHAVGPLEFLAGYALTSEDENWGGLSGMAVSGDGATLTAVADTGRWYRFGLDHDSTGRLTGFRGAESGWLLDTDGRPPKKKIHGDAESITALPDGGFLVGFEQRHRIWLYKPTPQGPAIAGPAVVAGVPPAIAELPLNGGIEAMARLPSGEYLLLSEFGTDEHGDRLGWIGRRKKWAELRLTPTGSFEPSDLALLPNGNLLLLERRVNLFDGFVSRLSVIDGRNVAPGAVLQPRELAILALPLSVDNFEAVSAR
ncbi:MAG TPA: esterase-like activity of phytase family protein [Dongiaceae bacterium]